MKKPELLAPAKSLEILKTAINYGADAVYIGGEVYGLRANAENFTPDEMREGIRYAHDRGKKVYVTANIIAKNEDLINASQYFKELQEIGPDAILVADPGMFSLARENCPDIDIHVSTQANNTNYLTCKVWHDMGATRVVTARELSLHEIKEIKEKIPADMEVESFVHGAMCISFSGRCLLSAYFTGRDANHGECTHPCRWKYALMEETRPGEYLPIYENERGTYIMNSKDLCMIEHIPDLIDAGIDSLKIEGRMKTALYVSTVVRAYRKAIDDLFESREKYDSNLKWYVSEIKSTTYRPFTTGFFYGQPSSEDQIYDNNTYLKGSTYIGTTGKVEENGTFHIQQKNKFTVGEEIVIMKTNGVNIDTKVLSINGEDGGHKESACAAKENLTIRLDVVPSTGDILRRMEA